MTYKEQLQQLKTQVDSQETALQKAQFVFDYIRVLIKSEQESKDEATALQQSFDTARLINKQNKIAELQAKGFKGDNSLEDYVKLLTESPHGVQNIMLNANAFFQESKGDVWFFINLYAQHKSN
jgi:hypothetical protein